jgi:hypothetical protein
VGSTSITTASSVVEVEGEEGVVVVLLLDFLQANVIAIIKGSSNLNLFEIIEVGLFIRCIKFNNPSKKNNINITEGILKLNHLL